MLRKIIILYSLLFFGFSFIAKGQSISGGGSCPPNIDFELGDLSYWHFLKGIVTPGPVFTETACTPEFGLHTLMAGTGLDKYGGYPVVDPGGGFYAFRLGRDTGDHYAVSALYYVHIPSGTTNYSLIYRYALDVEAAGHLPSQQPSFIAVGFDSLTGKLIPCAQDTFIVVTGGVQTLLGPSAIYSPTSGQYDVQWLPWSTVSVNLSGLEGHTIGIEFTASGCTYTAHFGYGYLDMTCGLFAIAAKICDDTLATLTGPSGFQTYDWFDSSTFSIHYGTTQTVTIPIPDTATTYAVVIEPFIGFGCPDTLYTRVMPSHLATHPSDDTLICGGMSIPLLTGATDSAIDLPLKYSWSPGASLTCTGCANPFATPTVTTTYYATVTDLAGCFKTDTIVVTADNVTTTTSRVNDSCFGSNNGSGTVTVVTGIPPYSYNWTTLPVQTTPTATSLTSNYPTPITYSVTVTDNLGCSDHASIPISEPPSNNLVIDSVKNPSTCFGSDGAIYLSGLVSGTAYTISYTVGGLPQTQSGLAGGVGSYTLNGLRQGVYDHITVVVTRLGRPWCSFNTVGPVVINDPVPPPLPAVGNNGPLCLGDTLKLNATDAVPGVVYQWSGPGGFGAIDTNNIVIPNVSYADSGVYTVTVTINLCSSTNTSIVVVKPVPFPSAGNNSAICAGDTLALASSSSNGATSYRWAGPDAYSSTLQNPVIMNADTLAAGTYTVIVTLNGCPQVDSTAVVINPIPLAPVTADTIYCQGEIPASLRASGAATMYWYTSPSFANETGIAPTPSTLVPGVYTWYVNQVSATTPACTSPLSAEQVKVYAKYNPQLSVSDSAICTGNQVTFTVSNAGDDAAGMSWGIGATDSIKDVNPLIHSFNAQGSYIISVTPLHEYCPDTTLTKTIYVYPYPVVDLGPDTSICPGGQPITLVDNINGGNKAAHFIWNTGETGPSIVVRKPGVYYTQVEIHGCPNSDTVIVANDCYLDIPNAFTPNGDGINDYFFPRQYLAKGLVSFSMNIYNRWGQLIFTTTNLDGMGWDGKFNGVLQPEGVYVYIINAVFKDGEIEHHQGNITLLN